MIERLSEGSKQMDIAGSVALVTGANGGIGRAFVAALLKRGAAKIYIGRAIRLRFGRNHGAPSVREVA
jgi:NAD(P)-dependent dehydrogenase (short-subunit alcohol dehydrogenase family)